MRKLLAVAVIALVLVIGIIGCDQTATPAPQPDTPRYTADQVIYIVRSQYPVCWSRSSGQYKETPTRIAVSYKGGGRHAWEVKISCPFGFLHENFGTGTKTLYFYEGDGSLHDKYYP